MNRKRKIAIVAGVATLAIAGGGAALAAGDAFSPEEESKAIIEDAAEELGVEPSELTDALKQALENRVDEAVDEGRLTEEQAQELKERLESMETPLLFGRFGFDHHGPWLGHVGPFATLETAASYLGLTEAELREKLADGKSLADVAEEEGKPVDGLVQALVEAANERIDEAVDDGKLTEEQATSLKEGLAERIEELVNHEPGSAPFGRHHRFGPGLDGFRPFAAPRA